MQKLELKIDKEKCLYCDNKATEDTKHFISECCGRGMCQECYGNLKDPNEQIHLAFFDTEPQDDEIIEKCGWENADYVCYECYGNWAYYVKQ